MKIGRHIVTVGFALVLSIGVWLAPSSAMAQVMTGVGRDMVVDQDPKHYILEEPGRLSVWAFYKFQTPEGLTTETTDTINTFWLILGSDGKITGSRSDTVVKPGAKDPIVFVRKLLKDGNFHDLKGNAALVAFDKIAGLEKGFSYMQYTNRGAKYPAKIEIYKSVGADKIILHTFLAGA